jgi:hypothetical protein
MELPHRAREVRRAQFCIAAIHISFGLVDFGTPYGGKTVTFIAIDRFIVSGLWLKP